MKVIDISGFGHSGKTVVTGILKEFDNYSVSDPNFEFNLLRIQGGLLDLKNALVDNWSPIRSDSAIRRYKKLIKRIGPKANFFKPSTLFYSNGMNYDSFFNDKFTELSHNYIESLFDYKYQGEWPYHGIEDSIYKQFIQRFKQNIFFTKPKKREIFVSSALDFSYKTKKYLDQLFENFSQNKFNNIVLHNSFEPFNPENSLVLFNNAKSIVVQRDPRDIYCSTIESEDKLFTPSFDKKNSHRNLKKNFLHSDDLTFFIERQKIYFQKVLLSKNKNILRLKYEDLIFDYDNQLKKIYNFLDENPTVHMNKQKYFNPLQSSKNVGLWKRFKNNKSVDRIYNELSDYCYH